VVRLKVSRLMVSYAGRVERAVANGKTTVRTYLPRSLGYLQEEIAGTGLPADESDSRSLRYYLKEGLGSVIGSMDVPVRTRCCQGTRRRCLSTSP
jgi:hypothetical protein